MTRRFEVSHATCGARGMRDLLHRQVETAIAQLPQREATDEQIHSARKHMKAARATLRLLRPTLSEMAYGRENRALRDAARILSAARDDAVLLKTLGELTRQTKGSGKRRRLSEFRARLQRDANRRRSELTRCGLRQSAARLRGALTMVDSWPTPPQEWKPVYRSLRDSYRKGRLCARCNAQHASGPTLHEWRKRAKYLRNQLELIAPVQHASVEAMSVKLHELSDHLGEEHDLAVLGELAHRSGRQLGRKADSALQKLIDKRRRKMRKRALAVGLPIYAEKPGHFESRLRHYFREWS
ncbi:MAG TPA: CHAD domain-containing protein [Steroidobacteraceae bacterium]|jgi:CHAD domain-containing protein|nr:CHAD domain-containing protein [Steroidobacteraceae bacterium]